MTPAFSPKLQASGFHNLCEIILSVTIVDPIFSATNQKVAAKGTVSPLNGKELDIMATETRFLLSIPLVLLIASLLLSACGEEYEAGRKAAELGVTAAAEADKQAEKAKESAEEFSRGVEDELDRQQSEGNCPASVALLPLALTVAVAGKRRRRTPTSRLLDR